MRKIVFYISGHGFGHAVRSIEVAKELLGMASGVEIIFKTRAPNRLFSSELSGAWRHVGFSSDCSMVQKDCLNIDLDATYREARDFFDMGNKKTEAEVEFCRSEGIEAVLGDIPPLAFAVAHKLGVPGIAIGNFSWDWVYAWYKKHNPGFGELAMRAGEDYEKASLLLRLPFCGDMSAFQRICDLPLIARKSQADPGEIRDRLGIGLDRAVVLVSSGGFDLPQLDLGPLARLKDYAFIFFSEPTFESGNFFRADIDGLKHQDLVLAADVVVSKPGYGIVSETIANEKPLLYTSRGDFPEYPILVEGLEKFGRPCFIAQDDFLKGKWGPHLRRAIAKSYNPAPIASNGAAAAAEKIASFLAL